MEQFFSQHILTLIEHYGAFGMFLGGFIEEIISVIPSSLIHITGGLLIMKHEPITFSAFLKLFFIIAAPSALGYTLGSLPYFYIVKKSGILIIEKYGKFIGFSKVEYDKFTTSLENRTDDDAIFWTLRLTPMIPGIFCNVYAGIIQMKLRTFLMITFIGVTIRAFVVSFIGWQLYSYIPVIITYKYYALALFLIVISTVYLIKTRKRGIK